MSRSLSLAAAAIAAGVVLPTSAQAYTCRPYGVEQHTYYVGDQPVKGYRLTWVC